MTNADAAPPIITLTTDFGLGDPYVAAMKGVLLGINPHARLVDVTHDIRPQQIGQALFVTQSAWPFFPSGAVHVAVVDPGVGTERRAIALETPGGRYVGPDNGVLSSALPDEVRRHVRHGGRAVSLLEGYRAISITNRRYLREPVSATFHGRDVFAPAAAHLSRGVPIDELGEPLESVVAWPPLRATRGDDGCLRGRVIHIDRFGNVITDILAADVHAAKFSVEVAGGAIGGPVRTYAELTGPGVIAGSSGYMEIALPSGRAAEALGVDIGAAAVLRVTP
jgi:S-adenosylmethionine hydrolase